MAEVMTVNGPISPDQLGITMPHVHLLFELTAAEQRPLSALMTATERALRDKPVTMDILGLIRRNTYCVQDNLILGDVEEAIRELLFYKRMGGSSVVEVSVIGLGRDPLGLKKISGETGVNVICGTGWYIHPSHPPSVRESRVEQLFDTMVSELTAGIGNTGVRAGVIKVGLSGATPDIPFTGSEEKVLRAAGRAQAETGAALTMHPCHHLGRARHWPTYLDILKEEGANLEKCYLSHMEFWAADIDYQKSLLDRGATVAYDQFGADDYARPGCCKPSDQARVQGVLKLAQAGYVRQVVLSNEVVRKTHLRKYGGYGYAHVLENIVCDLRYFGVTEEQLRTMLVENPRRLLAF